jgi:ribosomal protein L11 methyltransferase
VVVNILLATILRLLQDGLSDYINPGGHVVLAGILDDQEAEVQAAAVEAGLKPISRRACGEWVAIMLAREI